MRMFICAISGIASLVLFALAGITAFADAYSAEDNGGSAKFTNFGQQYTLVCPDERITKFVSMKDAEHQIVDLGMYYRSGSISITFRNGSKVRIQPGAGCFIIEEEKED